MGVTTKDFDPIREDYTFFEDHATEAAEDLQAYAPHVQALAARCDRLRLLDFGCGPGRFTERFLPLLQMPPERLEVSLVEPVEAYRRQAVERLQPATAKPVRAWPELPTGTEVWFDLVLANHVLYYVPDLDSVLSALCRVLDRPGLLVMAVAGQRNTLIQFWNQAFALIGKPVPYHMAEDVGAALDGLGIAYGKYDVRYELAFADTEENRLKILRFLMGSYFPQMPRQALLDLFAPYAQAGHIRMAIVHEQFVVRHEAAPAG
jgi:trans-aconitate 2-methyltransferase